MNLSSFCWPALKRRKRNQCIETDSESCVALQDPVVPSRTAASPDLIVSGTLRASCDLEMCPEVFCLTDDDSESESIKSQNTCVSFFAQILLCNAFNQMSQHEVVKVNKKTTRRHV